MKKRAATAADELPETKRKLMEAGVDVMRLKGYNATTVDNVCAEAGVTKGGFFHYFSSKEDLATAALKYFRDAQTEEMRTAAFRKLEDPLERVYGRLDFVTSVRAGARLTRGCLIGNFAQELSFTHPELRGVCDEMFARMAEDIERDLAEAKARHAPKAAFEPKAVAMLYVSITQGSLMLAKASASNAVYRSNVAQFKQYLETLFARKG